VSACSRFFLSLLFLTLFFHCSFLLTHFLCSGVSLPQATLPSGKYLLQHGASTSCSPFRVVSRSAMEDLLLLWPWCSLIPSLLVFCPFLRMFPRGTTHFAEGLSCSPGGCVAAVWNWLYLTWGSPWPLLIKTTPAVSPLSKPTANTPCCRIPFRNTQTL